MVCKCGEAALSSRDNNPATAIRINQTLAPDRCHLGEFPVEGLRAGRPCRKSVFQPEKLGSHVQPEKVFAELIFSLINYLQIAAFENMEALWIPVLFQIGTIATSFTLVLPLLVWGPYRVALLGFYVNVYLRFKDSYTSTIKELTSERALISPYRFATSEELGTFEDVCAVCLNPMKLARITPCHHIFHGDCLRKWVKTSNNCPICKRELKFD
ncbi:unnamed protein product [Nesidiocoris tenuis]|uniref:RING-type domain-containing protein n=1 Tax=Nesidiocoris tenuis TaxID=355587 RepID=A0A6H5GKW7_9HEMI|nr:unnamed protein product [Nesidiocoris tenuis]